MNVRWDAVAKSGFFGRELPEAGVRDRCLGARSRRSDKATLVVQVWLFGPLARHSRGVPVVLELASPCRVRDVIDQLETRVGLDLHGHVIGRKGEVRETCRVAVDGMLVRDLSITIPANRSIATVELILFQEIEGG